MVRDPLAGSKRNWIPVSLPLTSPIGPEKRLQVHVEIVWAMSLLIPRGPENGVLWTDAFVRGSLGCTHYNRESAANSVPEAGKEGNEPSGNEQDQQLHLGPTVPNYSWKPFKIYIIIFKVPLKQAVCFLGKS